MVERGLVVCQSNLVNPVQFWPSPDFGRTRSKFGLAPHANPELALLNNALLTSLLTTPSIAQTSEHAHHSALVAHINTCLVPDRGSGPSERPPKCDGRCEGVKIQGGPFSTLIVSTDIAMLSLAIDMNPLRVLDALPRQASSTPCPTSQIAPMLIKSHARHGIPNVTRLFPPWMLTRTRTICSTRRGGADI